MKHYDRVWAEVDLDAIGTNIESIKKSIKPETKIIAVIKTDGYGHGAIPIARILEQDDAVWGYAVATAEEAHALREKGILIGTHIPKIADISDRNFENIETDVNALSNMQFAVLDSQKGEEMQKKINEVRAEGDSVGGVLETAVCGIPAGVGEPWFDSVESMLSHALFSIPAVKGVEFGSGFSLAEMTGSVANDPFEFVDGKMVTKSNNNGGINGGITNGMPIIFRTAIKPTPTISKEQKTVDIRDNSNTVLAAKGRHDPCIVHRARVVVDSVAAITLCDLLSAKFGTDWMAK